ncbi:MAG: hypothetical protein H3C47_04850 [Candidatus Cloacimonetes bacterium]|nr:hypothetical protein [Candidatus Cloacimonadota bacterium]
MKLLIRKLPIYGVCIHSKKITCYETPEEIGKILSVEESRNQEGKSEFAVSLRQEASTLRPVMKTNGK